jgi:Protein of unknown function (DUF3187)
LISPGVDRLRPRICCRWASLLVVVCTVPAVSEPLYVKNLSPLTGLLGLPAQRLAAPQALNSFGLALHSSVASHYVTDNNAGEKLNLDGETARFALEARYGFSENWDVQVEVPWLKHSGGHLDSLIDNWHSFWGLPDGGRPDVDKNLLDYRYLGPDGSFALLDDSSGLGDVTVSVNRAIYSSPGAVASIGMGYKFATGDADEFLGSGGDDVFLALRFSGDHMSDLPLRWHGQLGYLRAGTWDVLAGAQERDVWFAGLAVDWQALDRVSFIGQLDLNSPPADSGLTALGDTAVLLSLGARWQFARSWSLDVNFVEDVQVETGPDVTFQASLRYTSD